MAEICVQHIYSGKVIDIWVCWQKDDPSNYSLGSTEQEAREGFSLRMEIKTEQVGDGWIATSGNITAHGPTRMEATKTCRRLVNLTVDKVDWRHLFFELLSHTGTTWESLAMHDREQAAIRRELDRREVARKVEGD